jgi:L-amino acid N-acyltransferase YncA
MSSARIRLAKEEDANEILAIYSPFILNTSYTFETDVPSEGEFRERIRTYLQAYPWLVCEMNNEIAGYAYAARHRERSAYQWSVESSIYIKDDYHHTEVAKALYSALIEILKKQGFVNVYAVINLPNDKSVRFHEKCGFTWFATYEKVGFKLGQWKNVGWWQLQVNDYINEPLEPVKFSAMDHSALKNIFENTEKIVNVKIQKS